MSSSCIDEFVDTTRSSSGRTTRLYGVSRASGNAGSALLAERTTCPLSSSLHQAAGHAQLAAAHGVMRVLKRGEHVAVRQPQ